LHGNDEHHEIGEKTSLNEIMAERKKERNSNHPRVSESAMRLLIQKSENDGDKVTGVAPSTV
jgi:hypothetical protein